MDNDDVLVRGLLNRREAMRMLGIGGAAAVGGLTLNRIPPNADPAGR